MRMIQFCSVLFQYSWISDLEKQANTKINENDSVVQCFVPVFMNQWSGEAGEHKDSWEWFSRAVFCSSIHESVIWRSRWTQRFMRMIQSCSVLFQYSWISDLEKQVNTKIHENDSVVQCFVPVLMNQWSGEAGEHKDSWEWFSRAVFCSSTHESVIWRSRRTQRFMRMIQFCSVLFQYSWISDLEKQANTKIHENDSVVQCFVPVLMNQWSGEAGEHKDSWEWFSRAVFCSSTHESVIWRSRWTQRFMRMIQSCSVLFQYSWISDLEKQVNTKIHENDSVLQCFVPVLMNQWSGEAGEHKDSWEWFSRAVFCSRTHESVIWRSRWTQRFMRMIQSCSVLFQYSWISDLEKQVNTKIHENDSVLQCFVPVLMNQWSGEAGEHKAGEMCWKDSWEWFSSAVFCSSTHESVIWRSRRTQRFMRMIQFCSVLFQYSWISDLEKQANTKIHENDSVVQCFVPVLMNQWSGEAGEHKDSWEWFSSAVFCSSTHESVIWRSRRTQSRWNVLKRFMRMIQSCSVLFQYSWISDLEKQANTKIHENDSVLQCFVPVLMNQWSGEAGEHKDSWEWFSSAVFCSSTHESVIWRSRWTQRFMRMIQFCSVLFQYSWISDLEKQANTKIHENDSVVQCFVPVLMNQWSGEAGEHKDSWEWFSRAVFCSSTHESVIWRNSWTQRFMRMIQSCSVLFQYSWISDLEKQLNTKIHENDSVVQCFVPVLMNQWSGEAGEHKDSWEWFSRAVFCSSTHESVIWRSRRTQRFMRMIQSCSVLFQYSWISDLEKQANTKIHENDSVLQCFVPVLMNQWSGEAGEHKDSWEWFSSAVFCSSTHESVIWRSRRTQRFMRMIQFCSVLFQYSWISDLEKQANTKIHENDSVLRCFVPVLMNQWSGEAGEHKAGEMCWKDSWEWFSSAVFCSSTHESVIWRSRRTQRFMRMIQSCSVLFQYSWISDLEKQANTKIHENDSVLQCFVPVLMNQWSGEAGEHKTGEMCWKDSWEWFSRAVFCSSTHESVIWSLSDVQLSVHPLLLCRICSWITVSLEIWGSLVIRWFRSIWLRWWWWTDSVLCTDIWTNTDQFT